MANLLPIFFLTIFGCRFYPTRAAAVTYETEATTEQLKQLLESQICQIMPQLPSCLRSNGSLEVPLESGGLSPVVDVVQDNAFLAIALDYIANTQQVNKELREQVKQQVGEIARLEQDKERLEGKVNALEEEWLPTVDKHPRISGSLVTGVSHNVSRPVFSYHPTASLLRPVDCSDHLLLGARVSGVYEIYPFKCRCSEPIKVWCDMETDGGGWTVFLMRQNQSHPVNFTRSWSEYRQGFGNASTEYWLGNDNLHIMTNTRAYMLRLDFQEKDGNFKWAEWPKFLVNDEVNKYKLEVPLFNSRSMTTNCLAVHNNRYFSTYDLDSDGSSSRNCAMDKKSGWWYNNCAALDPVIPFTPEGHLHTACIYKVNGKNIPLQGPFLQMKMRPTICNQMIKAVHFNSHTCEGHNGL